MSLYYHSGSAGSSSGSGFFGTILNGAKATVSWVGYLFSWSSSSSAEQAPPNTNNSPSASPENSPPRNNENQIQQQQNQYQQHYFFAKHLSNEQDDHRFLASKYHQGLALIQRQKQEKQQAKRNKIIISPSSSGNFSSSSNNSSSTTDGPATPHNDSASSFPMCKICSVQPATYCASDLNGVFVDNNNTTNNNSKTNNKSDPNNESSVQICLGCFVVAFRCMVLPELVNRDPEQKKAIEKMIQLIEEADEEESANANGNDQDNDEGSSSRENSNITLPVARAKSRSLSSQQNANNERSLLCVSCRFPCLEFTHKVDCPQCSATSPWSITCTECKKICADAKTPPICAKTDRLHVLWSCEGCTVTNTQDVPQCPTCNHMRSWKCPKCKSTQNSPRSAQNERHCSFCLYTFADMSSTTIRKFGLEEESVRKADKAHHERVRAAYKIDQKMELLFLSSSKNTNATSSTTTKKGSSKKQASSMSLVAKLKRTSQEGDGNCAFRSLSYNLFGTPSGHMLIRKAVCIGLFQRRDELAPWFESPQAFANYVTLMEQSGTWADEMALRMAAIIFGINVHIISSDAKHWHHRFSPFKASFAWDEAEEERLRKMTERQRNAEEKKKKEKENSRPHVFLAYSAPVHYDSLSILLLAPSSNNNDDDSGSSASNSTSASTARIQPVSISRLIKDLSESFVKEEEEWDNVDDDY